MILRFFFFFFNIWSSCIEKPVLICCCWVTSVVSDSVQPHRRQPTRLPCPWDSPGKNTGVGCHFLEKTEEPEVKLPTSAGSSKKQEFQKDIYFCFIDYAKASDWVDHNKLWTILKEMEYQTSWPASWEICLQVKKKQLELDMEQQTGSKSRKEYIKVIYCQPAYLTYMEHTSWEMLDWMKHKQNQVCREKYQ